MGVEGGGMKIWFISDTHTHHASLSIPNGVDMVIHCGDEANSRDRAINSAESQAFFEWYGALQIEHKVFVPGNHSIAFRDGLSKAPADVHVLIDEEATIGGVRMYGSPWTPAWGNSWAYMRARHKMDVVWQGVPDGLDVLITHGPPKQALDLTHDRDTGALINVGCAALRNRVVAAKPRIHCFGHIHDEKGAWNYGSYSRGWTNYINCSVCDRQGRLKNDGFIVDARIV